MEIDKSQRNSYKFDTFVFVEAEEYREQLQSQIDLMTSFISGHIYPTEVELYHEKNDFSLLLWYDQKLICINTGICTELICDMLCNNVALHFALYRESLSCLQVIEAAERMLKIQAKT